MAVNKIIYGNNTLIDLTGDTVDSAHLASGYTAHDKAGNLITGTLIADRGLHFCGGKIFYIDSTASGADYTFYDADGNVLNDVRVGDTPYFYKKIGIPNKDKYYVFNENAVTDKIWTYETAPEAWVYNLLGTEDGIGKGKSNTAIVNAADGGAYVNHGGWGGTIWNALKDLNTVADKGCMDWYVPSQAELNALRLAVDRGGNPVTTLFANIYIWSSFEYSSGNSWSWYFDSQVWWHGTKNSYSALLATRSF